MSPIVQIQGVCDAHISRKKGHFMTCGVCRLFPPEFMCSTVDNHIIKHGSTPQWKKRKYKRKSASPIFSDRPQLSDPTCTPQTNVSRDHLGVILDSSSSTDGQITPHSSQVTTTKKCYGITPHSSG